jgi:hypothetical protein
MFFIFAPTTLGMKSLVVAEQVLKSEILHLQDQKLETCGLSRILVLSLFITIRPGLKWAEVALLAQLGRLERLERLEQQGRLEQQVPLE